jgi:hypothetical protein
MIKCIEGTDLKIKNNMLNPKNELLQAIHFLLRLDSPYATLKTSLSGLIGMDLDEAKNDVRVRVSNMETLLKQDYAVSKVIIQDLEKVSDRFVLDLLIIMANGTTLQETF